MTPPPETDSPLTLLAGRRPARSGQPWTDEDYEQLIDLVREGLGTYAIAEALGRSDGAVSLRLRALLPPEERSCLGDRVLPTLRTHLRDRPDYPWAEIMVQSPPPAPVVRQVVQRHGIAGLEDAQLTEVAWAMLNCETTDDQVLQDVCSEVDTRRLDRTVTDRLTRALERRVPPLTPDEASHAAQVRFERASGRLPEDRRRDAYGTRGHGDHGYW